MPLKKAPKVAEFLVKPELLEAIGFQVTKSALQEAQLWKFQIESPQIINFCAGASL